MRRVIIESPYAGKGWWLLRLWRCWRNKRYARACLKDSLRLGEAPFASHLLYTQPGVLDDNKPGERLLGIHAGFAWAEGVKLVAVYIDRGISSAMKLGIEAHAAEGRAIIYRSLGRNWPCGAKTVAAPAPRGRKPQ